MQIRLKEDMTREDALALLDVANAEVDTLRQQLADAHQTIERREAVIAVLERHICQLELEIEAIGAGGVSLMGSRA